MLVHHKLICVFSLKAVLSLRAIFRVSPSGATDRITVGPDGNLWFATSTFYARTSERATCLI